MGSRPTSTEGGQTVNPVFWQEETAVLLEAIMKRLFSQRADVSLSTILRGGFPQVLVASVLKRAGEILAHESPVVVKHGWRYPADDRDIQELLGRLNDVLLSATRFKYEELLHIAEDAIRFEMAVIVRPRQKMLALLSKDEKSFAKADIETIVRGFGEKRLYVDRVLAALSDLRAQELSASELERLSKRVERAVYSEHPLSAVLQEVKLYQEFRSAALGDEQRTIKSEVLLALLRERGLTALLHEIAPEAQSKDGWSLPEIEHALQRHILVGRIEQSAMDDLDIEAGRLTRNRPDPAGADEDLDNFLFDFLPEAGDPEDRNQ